LIGGTVAAVSRSPEYTFKQAESDQYPAASRTWRGRRRAYGRDGQAYARAWARDPSQPNLRQVHLIHAELHDELRGAGFMVSAGQMGENITTRGIDLLALPTGTRLHLGGEAIVEVTGLRNPCGQLDGFQPGLRAATLGRDEHGELIRKAGIMSVVLADGEVRPGDGIRVELPPVPHRPLEPV